MILRLKKIKSSWESIYVAIITKPSVLFIFLSIGSVFIIEITYKLLNFDVLVYNSFFEKLSRQQINDYFEFQEKWKWLGYTILPIIFAIKTSAVASACYIGTFFFSAKQISFKKLFSIVITAEFVFLLVPVFKIIWFYFFQTKFTLEDIQYFYPLSALSIVGYEGLEPWLLYPFQTLNLFELAYWLLLAYYIGKATETTMDHGLKIVASSYGSALLLWVVVVMFFTLNYS